jgi:hypothetical protein
MLPLSGAALSFVMLSLRASTFLENHQYKVKTVVGFGQYPFIETGNGDLETGVCMWPGFQLPASGSNQSTATGPDRPSAKPVPDGYYPKAKP